MSLVDCSQPQNFSCKIWSLEFTASSSKSLEGFRKGLRVGSNRKEIVSQVDFDVKGAQIFQNTLFRGVQSGTLF